MEGTKEFLELEIKSGQPDSDQSKQYFEGSPQHESLTGIGEEGKKKG